MRKRNAKRYLQAEEIFVPQSSVEGEPSDVNLCSQNLSDCEKVTTGNVLLSGRIHSVFHHVINVVTEQGTLFSLVNQGTETFAGAISLVEDIDLKTLLLKAGDPVVWQTDMICLGSLVHISMDHVQVQTVPYVPEIGQNISRQTISRISHLVEIYGNKSSLYDALFDQPYLDKYGRMFRERLHRLQAALAAGTALENRKNGTDQVAAETQKACTDQVVPADQNACTSQRCFDYDYQSKIRQAVSGFLGLGIGMTPSGDDFLCGLFAAAYARGDSWRGAMDMDRYRDWIRGSTGAVSSAMLENAWRGLVRRSLWQLFDAMAQGDWEVQKRAVHNVIRYGSTSGTDMMCGVLFGLSGGTNI